MMPHLHFKKAVVLFIWSTSFILIYNINYIKATIFNQFNKWKEQLLEEIKVRDAHSKQAFWQQENFSPPIEEQLQHEVLLELHNTFLHEAQICIVLAFTCGVILTISYQLHKQ